MRPRPPAIGVPIVTEKKTTNLVQSPGLPAVGASRNPSPSRSIREEPFESGYREPKPRESDGCFVKSFESRGFTPTEVAERAGVNRAGISRFLAGKRGLTLATADKIAAAFHLRLIEGEPPRPRGRRPASPTAGG